MNQIREDSIDGLKDELNRLPRFEKGPALTALNRLIFNDAFGEREPPLAVVASCRGRRVLATLFVMHGGGFSFHLFLVECAKGAQRLAVAHIYRWHPEYRPQLSFA
jgi:hypothetical protein